MTEADAPLPIDRSSPPLPVYRADKNPRFRGNPFIEALPDIPTTEEAYESLAHRPLPRPEGFRLLARNRKIDLLGELQQLFVPTHQHIRALQNIVGAIRDCYEYRDLNRPAVQERLYNVARGQRIGITRLSPTGGGSNGMVLWGITGSGKTSFVDRLEEFIYSQQASDPAIARRPIYHRLVQGMPSLWPQLPIVRIQCNITLKGTIRALFAQIDGALGTGLGGTISSRASREEMVESVKQVLTIHFVGLLVVEDVHKLTDTASVVLEYFCDIMEEAGFPVLLVGTYKFRRPLVADLAVASKLTAKGKFEFALMELSGERDDDSSDAEGTEALDEDDEDEWTPFVEEMWSLNVFSKPRKMPSGFRAWLHFHTMGIRRIARLMMRALFERSLDDEDIVVNIDLLDRIASVELLEFQEALNWLRMRAIGLPLDDDLAAQYEHLMLPLDPNLAFEDAVKTRKNTQSRSKLESADLKGSVKSNPSAKKAMTKRKRKPTHTLPPATAEQVYAKFKKGRKN